MAPRFRTKTTSKPVPFDPAVHRLVEDTKRRLRDRAVSMDADRANRDWRKGGRVPGQEASQIRQAERLLGEPTPQVRQF